MRAYWKNLHLNSETIGLIYGFLGVVGFSLTLPATRASVQYQELTKQTGNDM